MIALSANHISKSYGIDIILEDISISLNEGEKAALVGSNGAGKSTLFKIIAGDLEKDQGDIYRGKDLQLGYLSQMVDIDSHRTLYQETLSIFEDVMLLEEEIQELEKIIAEQGEEGHSKDLEQSMKRYSEKTEEFQKKNGYAYRSEARGILKGLGFSDQDMEKEVRILSGGEKTRLALSRLLLKNPDILLLDEPTNHLDTYAVEWLETYLKQYKGSLLIISHDRYFLDEIVTCVYQLTHHKMTSFPGNYTDYLIQREEREEQEEKLYKENQEELRRQRDIIAQLRAFGREKQVKRARSREKLLTKMAVVDKPQAQQRKVAIRFEPQIKSGYDVLETRDLSKSFDQRNLFQDLSLNLYRGEKVALIGPNGIGKTTLFNILLGKDKEFSGGIKLGTGVHPAYFDQRRDDLTPGQNVLEEIWRLHPRMTQTHVRSLLAGFLFIGDDVFKQTDDLSGGEKARVSLLKMMLSEANFLFMDEPTNHLDIDSREVLENALLSYDGTLFVISHDRYFLNKIADRLLVLNENGLEEYLGNYDYYQEKLKEKKEGSAMEEAMIELNKTRDKDRKRKEKEREKTLRSLKKAIQDAEEEVHRLEGVILDLQNDLCKEEIYCDPVKAKRTQDYLSQAEEKMMKAMENWEESIERSEEAERIAQK